MNSRRPRPSRSAPRPDPRAASRFQPHAPAPSRHPATLRGYDLLNEARPRVHRQARALLATTGRVADDLVAIVFDDRHPSLGELARSLGATGSPPVALLRWPSVERPLRSVGICFLRNIAPEGALRVAAVTEDACVTAFDYLEDPILAPFPPVARVGPKERAVFGAFDEVPTTLIVLGADSGDLARDLTRAEAPTSFADAGIEVVDRPAVALGLYPIVVFPTDQVFDRDRRGLEVLDLFKRLLGLQRAMSRVQTIFAAEDVYARFCAQIEGLIEVRGGTASGDSPTRQLVFVDSFKGQKVTWMILGRRPIFRPPPS